MRGRSWAAIGGVFLSLALSATASAQFSPGARSLGDVLPAEASATAGYDAQHYDLTHQLRPGREHFMTSTTADITLRATQGAVGVLARLPRTSTVTGVTVDGVAATFTRDGDRGRPLSTS